MTNVQAVDNLKVIREMMKAVQEKVALTSVTAEDEFQILELVMSQSLHLSPGQENALMMRIYIY